MHYHSIDRLKDQIRPEAPDPTVSGTNDTDKLQDVYRKYKLFHWHLKKVMKFQETWIRYEEDNVLNRLFIDVKGRLFNFGVHLNQTLLRLNMSVPVVDTLVNLSAVIYDTDKQLYGYNVIDRLESWLSAVYKLLENLM